MNKNVVSVVDAAKELGMSPTQVRIRMDRGLLPIGECFPSIQGNQTRYYIYRDRLDRFIKGE